MFSDAAASKPSMKFALLMLGAMYTRSFAPGAMPPLSSTSRSVSPSPSVLFVLAVSPPSTFTLVMRDCDTLRPICFQNEYASAALKVFSVTMPIVVPRPVTPRLLSGVTS